LRRLNIKFDISQQALNKHLLQPQNLIFLILAIVGILYSHTIGSLYYLWMESGNPAYTHGSLAFLIAVYVFARFWFNQDESTSPPLHVSLDVVGLIFLCGSAFLWLLASLGNIQVVQQLALLGVVVFIFWSAFGYKVFKVMVIPLFIMLTAIPLWDFLDIYLQRITAVGVSFLLNLTTIPYLKEGVQILLQSGTFEIADRCSGLRMVTAIVPVALLYSYQWNFKAPVTFIYVLLSILVAILANVVRIFIVVVAGHLTNMQHYFVTTDHVTLGWVVFGIIVLLFIFASNKVLLNDKWYPDKLVKEKTEFRSVPVQNARLKYFVNVSATSRPGLIVLSIVGMIVISTPVLAEFFNSVTSNAISRIEIQDKYGDWQKLEFVSGQWSPVYRGQSLDRLVAFQNTSGKSIELFLAYYAHQEQGKEAIHYENRSFDPVKWKLDSKKMFSRNIGGIGKISVTEYKVYALTGQKKLIWQWYYVGGNRTNSAAKTKIYEILAKIKRNPAISVIMLATDIQSDEEKAIQRMENFLSNALIPLEHNIDSIN